MIYTATMEEPRQWRAGFTGTEETDGYKPFYFGCGLCGEKEPVIYGYLTMAEDGQGFENLALLGDLKHFDIAPAIFCGTCFDRVLLYGIRLVYLKPADSGVCGILVDHESRRILVTKETEQSWFGFPTQNLACPELEYPKYAWTKE